MPGKNQTKRRNKNIAHAKLVWTRKALGAANAWKAIKEALDLIQGNRGELSDDDLKLIEAQVEHQRTAIAELLANATNALYDEVGDDIADEHLQRFLPEALPGLEASLTDLRP